MTFKKEYFQGALAVIVLLVLFNLLMPEMFHSVVISNLPNSDIVHNVAIKDSVLRKKINTVNTNLNNLFLKSSTDFCKKKKDIKGMIKLFMVVARSEQKLNPDQVNFICNFKKGSMNNNGYGNGNGNGWMNSNEYKQIMRMSAPYAKDIEKLKMSIADLMQYTLKTHFCKKGVLSIDKLETYLLNMVEQICSGTGHTATVYDKFVKYNISKPFQFI